MNNLLISSFFSIVTLVHSGVVMGDHADSQHSENIIEEVYITGGKDGVRKTPGSATFLDDEAIKKFDTTDLTDLLGQVPGIYVRFEDGYGLRPNIGIRGATSDRSQKVTIMEDGVLISPAPYSAPAAYYIPNVNRMDAVEVFKGPSAIKYGPHTVGGALNLVTKAMPEQNEGSVETTLGSDNYQKFRVFYGDSETTSDALFGYWIDALRYSADGFKELGDENTGFVRNDINAKFLWHTQNAAIPQKIIVKLGYADEDSDETYLGITDEDFAINPLLRYPASSQDKFTSEHTQLHVMHVIEPASAWRVSSRAYVNRFARDWTKLDGFAKNGDCPSIFVDGQQQELNCTLLLSEVLDSPVVYPYELGILRGQNNSLRAGEYLDVTSNDRNYGSEGVEVSASQTWGEVLVGENKDLESLTTYGLRYHRDYVDRFHQPFTYEMQNGIMQLLNLDLEPKTINRSEAAAIAAYVDHQVKLSRFKLNVGVRYESINGKVIEYLDQSGAQVEIKSTDNIVMPGAGLFYQWSDSLGFLLGVNKGFSPAVAGSGADAEESINYEYGFRYENNIFTLDSIGFYSDYSNYIGRCRASDPDCNGGLDEFNAGGANIFGAEVTSTYIKNFSSGIAIPVSFSYTYTDATFAESFNSNFVQWGNVLEGDELPYTPEHQAHWNIGLDTLNWSWAVAGKFVGKMREFPGQGKYEEGRYTPSHTLWDISMRYIPDNNFEFLLAAENIFDKQVIVSRRPFGARPNQPLSIKAGVTYNF